MIFATRILVKNTYNILGLFFFSCFCNTMNLFLEFKKYCVTEIAVKDFSWEWTNKCDILKCIEVLVILFFSPRSILQHEIFVLRS